MKALLSGNEAVARGAFEAGVEIAAAYPGTPSTEILENIAKNKEISAQWSVNEKIAFEVAMGGAMGGKRSLAAMKHVGVNVASDTLLTAAYTGVNAGLVLISADDPGMHSSQNEQDNRFYARLAKIPMLEPSDSEETKAFTIRAFELSEQFDTPVMLRLTTRLCHGKGCVELGDRKAPPERKYGKNPQKYVMIPAYARERHLIVEERRKQLEQFAETFDGNRVEMGDTAVGIITSGISYQYAKEVFPDASILKLGMTFPLPAEAIKSFAKKVKWLYVIEELEPFLEDQIKALGINAAGKKILPRTGELSPEIIREALLEEEDEQGEDLSVSLPARPPVMCPGCSHRGVFYVLHKLKATVSGDIGCYTLSTLPPLETMDSCISMGASIGVAQGLSLSLEGSRANRTVAILGDSTFIHAGIPSLVNAVYNGHNITVIILDNSTTAMTGHQDNPGTGRTLQGGDTLQFDFEGVAKAIGVKHVRTIDPMDIEETERAVKEAWSRSGPSVIIAQRACVLVERDQYSGAVKVASELCTLCRLCLRLGCPAVSMNGDSAVIDPLLCAGCELCVQLCPKEAITLESK